MNKLVISAAALLMLCAPAAQAKPRHHHRNGGKYAMNSQMQQLKAQQKAERQACKAERGGAGCAGLKERQRDQRQELKQALSGKRK